MLDLGLDLFFEAEVEADSALVLGDSREVMRLLPNGSIDLTVTSPPYDNLRTYEGSLVWGWDAFTAIADELWRVTSEGGVIVWVVGDATVKGSETGTSFRQALYFKEIGFNLHDTMVWDKGGFSAVGSLRSRYAPVFEYMFVMSKGRPKSFNPIKDKINKHVGKMITKTKRLPNGDTEKGASYVGAELGQRYNIWSIWPQRQGGDDVHPAPFPESLARDHIVSWSAPGAVVFDPFLGSGTTGKMALTEGRKFIGIEKVSRYYEIAKARIAEAANAALFG